MHASLVELEKKLWSAADELRANSELKSSEYSVPVLGLIFLRYADVKFANAKKEIEGKVSARRTPSKVDYFAKGVLYLPEAARFSYLLNLPEGKDIGKELNEAMGLVEQENPELKGVLPKSYQKVGNDSLATLLKTFNSIPLDIEGDAFGKIYEYFLGEFAKAEGQKGGEFFTPTALVKLIVEIIEPFHGRIYDPACGSGGMFVQSANFVAEHKKKPLDELTIFGEERVNETARLCKMNLAVHGLSGDIRQGNSYYEDIHDSRGQFDFVMANPPFNVNGIDKERIKDDQRFPFGRPKTDNGNYVWIQLFYSSLNATGRAGFVMANSASDARGSELEIRKALIEAKAVDVMVAIGPNFFYTVTLPCTLWFFDKSKSTLPPAQPSPPAPLPVGEGLGVRVTGFADATRCYSSTPVTSSASSIGPIAISPPTRSSSSPISPGFTGAKRWRRPTAAGRRSGRPSPAAGTSMPPACAKWRASRRSRRRGGASIRVGMSGWPIGRKRISTLPSGWRS